MKFISWNVNGLRACVQKGFLDFFNQANADFFCLQETKLQEGQIALDLPGYEQYWCYAEKKGYSGTAIFTKHTPLSVRYGIGIPDLDTEGRVITLEYPEFFLVTCYTPNAQRELARIDHRMRWEEAFREYLMKLDSQNPVILCGDLNVAHQEIDLKNPSSNRGSAGFSDQERAAFTRLLESGFTDTFRHLNPDATGCYTWWSYMFNARKNNAGWRIDYFLVSDRLKDVIYSTPIHSDILGSDHCPVELELGISCNGGIWKSDSEGDAALLKGEGLPISPKAKKILLSGSACLLLVLGFLAGFFTNRLIGGNDADPFPNEYIPDSPIMFPTPSVSGELFSCISAQEELTTVLAQPSIFSSTLYASGFSDGTTVWKTDQYDPFLSGNPPCGFNFWIRVIPASPADVEACRVFTQFTGEEPVDSAYPANLQYTRYYSQTGQFAGWFVFGYIPWDVDIVISLLDENDNFLQGMILPVSPILTEADAMQMSTVELLDFAMHWQGLIPPVTSSIESLLTPDTYRAYWDTQPALKVLLYRKDFHSLLDLLEEYYSKQPTTYVQTILLSSLDEQLQKAYGKYGTYPSLEEAMAMTTGHLVDFLAQHDGFFLYMTEDMLSSTFPVSLNSYEDAKLFNPILEILENREDALDELLQHMHSSFIVRQILNQPVYLRSATPAQAQKYLDILYDGNLQDISTENLLYFVRNLDMVHSSVIVSSPYTYSELSQLFQPVKELENRADTIDILLTCLTEPVYGGDGNEKRFATYLLKQSVYYDRMTYSQKQTFEQFKVEILYGSLTPTVDPVALQPRFLAPSTPS